MRRTIGLAALWAVQLYVFHEGWPTRWSWIATSRGFRWIEGAAADVWIWCGCPGWMIDDAQ